MRSRALVLVLTAAAMAASTTIADASTTSMSGTTVPRLVAQGSEIVNRFSGLCLTGMGEDRPTQMRWCGANYSGQRFGLR